MKKIIRKIYYFWGWIVVLFRFMRVLFKSREAVFNVMKILFKRMLKVVIHIIVFVFLDLNKYYFFLIFKKDKKNYTKNDVWIIYFIFVCHMLLLIKMIEVSYDIILVIRILF